MFNLIYCKNFTNAPRDCSGIAYQITYDQYGNPDGVYRCNFCYQEKSMSEHSVLLATQNKVTTLETENIELRARNAKLEIDVNILKAKLNMVNKTLDRLAEIINLKTQTILAKMNDLNIIS